MSAQLESSTIAFVTVDDEGDCTVGSGNGIGGSGGGFGGGTIGSLVSVCDPCVNFLIQGALPCLSLGL